MALASSLVLSVRVTSSERALLESAAQQSRTTLSDFVRRKAIESAEAELLNRLVVTIPAADWADFEAWLERPGQPKEALTKLARQTPSWER